MLKLILFDIDGTLLITQGASREAKARAMLEIFGTESTVREHPFGGKTDWQILSEVLATQGLSIDDIGARMGEYQARFAMHMAAIIDEFPVRPCPGALELVDTLRQRDDLLLGIVTGNTALTAPIKLRAGGFDPAWFKVGAYGSESANRNDLPGRALERAISHSGIPIAPHDVMVIGDTQADVECARALGAVAVTVFTGFEDRGTIIAAQPDYMLEDLTHFLDMVPL